MEAWALSFVSGWASGINAYLAVLVLGISDRLHDFSQVPDALARWDVLAISGALFTVEFVADKIPWVDTVWDAVSTVVRPLVGALLGVLLAGDADSLQQAASGLLAGGTALASHGVKAGARMAANTSPEPFTNIGLSLGEDLTVLTVMVFAVQHPQAAAVIAAVLLVLGVVAVLALMKLVRAGWQRWQARRRPSLT